MSGSIARFIRGTADSISNVPVLDGQILVTTDTLSLFTDYGNSRLKLNSGSSSSSSISVIGVDRPDSGVHLLLKYAPLNGNLDTAITYIDTRAGTNIGFVKCVQNTSSGYQLLDFPIDGCTGSEFSNKVSIDLSSLPITEGMLYYTWYDSSDILSTYNYIIYPCLYFPPTFQYSSDTDNNSVSIPVPLYSVNFILKAGNVTDYTEDISSLTTIVDTSNGIYDTMVNIPSNSIEAAEGDNITISNTTNYNVFLGAFVNDSGDRGDYSILAIPPTKVTYPSLTSVIKVSYFWFDDNLNVVSSGSLDLNVDSMSDCEYISIQKPEGALHLRIKNGAEVLADTYHNINIHNIKYCLYSGNEITWKSPASDEGIPSVSNGYPVFLFTN